MLRLKRGILAMGIPFVFSWIAVVKHSVLLFVALFFLHFILLKIVPGFRRRESLWMFIIVSVSSIPFNLYILSYLDECGFIFGSMFILGVLKCVLYYIVILSVEELVMGVLTRLIWKRQYKIEL